MVHYLSLLFWTWNRGLYLRYKVGALYTYMYCKENCDVVHNMDSKIRRELPELSQKSVLARWNHGATKEIKSSVQVHSLVYFGKV